MTEVVQKEILKQLDARVIYPIADSEWVSPIHVVPRKGRITVVQNKEGELIHTRVQSGWRVSIDYRKLNMSRKRAIFHCSLWTKWQRDQLGGHIIAFLMDIQVIFKSLQLLRIRKRPLLPDLLAPILLEGCLLVYVMLLQYFKDV